MAVVINGNLYAMFSGTLNTPSRLTDSQGQLLVRKALLPRDFGVRRDSLAGAAELNLQAVLATGESRVVGYTVEIFYP